MNKTLFDSKDEMPVKFIVKVRLAQYTMDLVKKLYGDYPIIDNMPIKVNLIPQDNTSPQLCFSFKLNVKQIPQSKNSLKTLLSMPEFSNSDWCNNYFKGYDTCVIKIGNTVSWDCQ